MLLGTPKRSIAAIVLSLTCVSGSYGRTAAEHEIVLAGASSSRCGRASSLLSFPMSEWHTAHRDDGQPQVAEPVQNPVQGGLIRQRPGDDDRISLDLDPQALEPLRPEIIQNAVHPDLVSGRPRDTTHGYEVPL